jgi:hypothetical protein
VLQRRTNAAFAVPITGPCDVFVSGGKAGGTVEIIDKHSGYQAAPELPPEGPNGQVLQLSVPGSVMHREIALRALTPGVVFYGIKTREPQPTCPHWTFDHSQLPGVA